VTLTAGDGIVPPIQVQKKKTGPRPRDHPGGIPSVHS